MEFEQAQKALYDYINRMRDSLAVYAKKLESKQSEIDKRNANIKQLTDIYNAYDLKYKQLNDNIKNLQDITITTDAPVSNTHPEGYMSSLADKQFDREKKRNQSIADSKLDMPHLY